tara:strand:+ start:433 stop:816 length:384 start_codon:yes stop_codon:yes gene_type:complete
MFGVVKLIKRLDKIMENKIENSINKYLKHLGEKFTVFANRSLTAAADEFINEYVDGLSFEVGRKYIKVTKTDRSGSTGVHSFIVNTKNDKKFKYGDILKAASWAAPARNFARGNVFGEYGHINWTGA